MCLQELNACAEPKPLTAADSKQRFADYVLDTARNRLIAVCEDHSQDGQEATNSIAAIGKSFACQFQQHSNTPAA